MKRWTGLLLGLIFCIGGIWGADRFLSPGEIPAAVWAETPVPSPTPEAASCSLRVEVLSSLPAVPAAASVTAEAVQKPLVIIYHTHTHESYTRETGQTYLELSAWRTEDTDYSVVRVGRALAEALCARGIPAIDIDTDHELRQLSTAYTRSLATLEELTARYPFALLYIDLHRDAYSQGIQPLSAALEAGEAARILLVVGKGEGFSPRPDWEKNYALAAYVGSRLAAVSPTLYRGISLKHDRYNQHMGSRNLLVEVGHNENTLTQALASVEPLADALAQAVKVGWD